MRCNLIARHGQRTTGQASQVASSCLDSHPSLMGKIRIYEIPNHVMVAEIAYWFTWRHISY